MHCCNHWWFSDYFLGYNLRLSISATGRRGAFTGWIIPAGRLCIYNYLTRDPYLNPFTPLRGNVKVCKLFRIELRGRGGIPLFEVHVGVFPLYPPVYAIGNGRDKILRVRKPVDAVYANLRFPFFSGKDSVVFRKRFRFFWKTYKE